MRQAIIWTTAGPISWRIYAALGRNESDDGLQNLKLSHTQPNTINWLHFSINLKATVHIYNLNVWELLYTIVKAKSTKYANSPNLKTLSNKYSTHAKIWITFTSFDMNRIPPHYIEKVFIFDNTVLNWT